MINWLGKASRFQIGFSSLAAVLWVGILDYTSGIELSFSIFYFLPIVIATWYLGLRAGIALSLLCASSWFLAEFIGGRVYSSSFILLFNTTVRLLIFLVVTWLIHMLKISRELAIQNELLAQKSFDVINTSQKIIGIIAENITVYNSALSLWIVRQKKKNKKVPRIVERTCDEIGSNLAALTEACFRYKPLDGYAVDAEQLTDSLREKVVEIKRRNISPSFRRRK